MESTSLWVGIPVEVRLPTVGSSQTPQKRNPHWEFVVVVVVVELKLVYQAPNPLLNGVFDCYFNDI